jgi:hypothetical protein
MMSMCCMYQLSWGTTVIDGLQHNMPEEHAASIVRLEWIRWRCGWFIETVKDRCPVTPTGGSWFPHFIRPLVLTWAAFCLQWIWLAMFLVECLYDLSTIFLLLTLTLKMEAACSTRMFVSPFKNVQYHNSEYPQSGKGSDWVLLKKKGSLSFRFRLKQLCSNPCFMRTRLYFRVCILNFHLIE